VKDLSKEKREKFSDNLLYAKFNRDVAEVKMLLLIVVELYQMCVSYWLFCLIMCQLIC